MLSHYAADGTIIQSFPNAVIVSGTNPVSVYDSNALIASVLGLIGGGLTVLGILHQLGLTWWRVRVMWRWFESEPRKISDE